MISAKYEEIYPPTIDDFAYICDSAYTKMHIMEMEGRILEVIDFN